MNERIVKRMWNFDGSLLRVLFFDDLSKNHVFEEPAQIDTQQIIPKALILIIRRLANRLIKLAHQRIVSNGA